MSLSPTLTIFYNVNRGDEVDLTSNWCLSAPSIFDNIRMSSVGHRSEASDRRLVE